MPKYLNAPKYMFDFYSITTQKLDSSAVPILFDIKEKIVDDASYCIYRELRHFEYSVRTHGMPSYYNTPINVWINWSRQFCRKTYKKYVDECNGQFLEGAKRVFNSEDWMDGFGGKPWAKITDAVIKLKNDNFSNVSKTVNLIDNLIHENHNTGICLDKLYPDIKYFLNAKRRRKDPLWINCRASKNVRAYNNKLRLNLI